MEKISVKRLILRQFQVVEAVNVLRTNLMFSGLNNRAVALTSSKSGDGKSTLAIQLAASLAEAGKRVVLLDTDLRKSMLASRLRYKGNTPGLSHYLSGMCNADEVLCETDVSGLYLILAGQRSPNPTELLGNENFSMLLPALKQSFDYVIVDAPPLGQVIDCAVIAPKLDGVMLVIDVTDNDYRMEQRIRQQVEKSGGRILGVILNRVNYAQNPKYYGKDSSYASNE